MILQGDCLAVLQTLPANSVHAVLRTLGLIVGRGELRASEELFS